MTNMSSLRPVPPSLGPSSSRSFGAGRESLRKKIAVLAPQSGDLGAMYPQAAVSSQKEGDRCASEEQPFARPGLNKASESTLERSSGRTDSSAMQDPAAPTDPRPPIPSFVSRRARFANMGAEEGSTEGHHQGLSLGSGDMQGLGSSDMNGLGSEDILEDEEFARAVPVPRHLSEPTPAARARQPALLSSSYQFSGQSEDDFSYSGGGCHDQQVQSPRYNRETSEPAFSSQESIEDNHSCSGSESEDSDGSELKVDGNVATMTLSLRMFQGSRKSSDATGKRPFAPMRPSSLPGCKNAKQLAEAAAAQAIDPDDKESILSAKCAIVQGQLLAAGDLWMLGIPLLGSQLAWSVAPPIPGQLEGLATICIVPDREWTQAQASRTGVMTCIGPVKNETKRKGFTVSRALNPLKFFKRRSSGDKATSKQKDAVDTSAKNSDAAGWLFTCMEVTARWVVQKLLGLGCVQIDLADAYELVLDQKHGAGSFGCVVRAIPRHGEGRAVAVKLLKKGTAEHKVMNEVEMLVAVQGHPQIIGFLGTFRVEGSEKIASPQWALAFDLHHKGDLYEKVAKGNRLQEREAMPLFIDILNALAYMGDKGIFHRDIKPENMLVGRGDRVVITDFGIACLVTDEAELKKVRGTVGYAAPEMLKGESVGNQGDAFGAGIVLFFMLSRSTPFYSPEINIMVERTHLCRVNLNYTCFEPLSTGCRNIILGLIEKDVKARLTVKQVQNYKVVMQGSVVRTEPSLAIFADMAQPPSGVEQVSGEAQARRSRARAAALEERMNLSRGSSRDSPAESKKSSHDDRLRAQDLASRYRAVAASSAGNLPPLRRVPENLQRYCSSSSSALKS
eukprot:TRINITY_DN29232_c0_g1_i1.p1 TRINITY_DN29232_c0_g1~~TRINITY_DN29232_c0_g1_i1.p1  ORF type:complete len:846 (-),score=150.44 TRINITY_DN29232_c0_g1_i1:19-2556(-)